MARTPIPESELGSALKKYASVIDAGRDARSIAAAAVAPRGPRRFPRRPALVAAAALGLVLSATGAVLLSQSGIAPASARVNGLDYGIAAARSLHVSSADLQPYGDVERFDSPIPIVGRTAFALKGVDPRQALVVPLQPGSQDGAGGFGDYALLVQGSFAAVCPYFDPASPATPDECRGGSAT